MTKRELLKSLIESGSCPIIVNASSGSSDEFYWSDVQALGWASKRYTHDCSGEVDGWIRTYSGPNTIALQTYGAKELQIIHPGETI